MKKAAIAVLFLAGAVVAAGESGKMGGFGNFISDVQMNCLKVIKTRKRL